MRNASWLEPFYNKIGKKKKLPTNVVNTFLLAWENTNNIFNMKDDNHHATNHGNQS